MLDATLPFITAALLDAFINPGVHVRVGEMRRFVFSGFGREAGKQESCNHWHQQHRANGYA